VIGAGVGAFYLSGNGGSSKITVTTLSVPRIMAATTMPPATARDAALRGERHALAAGLIECLDGDKACVNRCMSKFRIEGIEWSDGTRLH
jgi:hypothetical protein